MRIVKFINNEGDPILAVYTDQEEIFALEQATFMELSEEAKHQQMNIKSYIEKFLNNKEPLQLKMESLDLVLPIEAPEVWAAGVTYTKSKEARNYETSENKNEKVGITFYDKVYDAERPEIFFKSTAARTVGPDDEVFLRSDSNWQIPEPELGLVLDKNGNVLGYLVGNDMSCRDIEGENPLYLPQAKVWKNSCSIGPSIRLAETVEDPYQFVITCKIFRNNKKVFEESASVSQLKRSFDELIQYLIQDNEVFDGTVLLTGTCIVPPNDFTLSSDDVIEIEIDGIGILRNVVKEQKKTRFAVL